MAAKIRLTIALIAFASWISVLAWTVWKNGQVPVVSRAQLTAMESLVVVDVVIDEQGLPQDSVKVKQVIAGQPVDGLIRIVNLPQAIAAGSYRTPTARDYAIPIVKDGDNFKIAGLPRSPGMNVPQPSRPTIYPWVEDVKKQLKALKVGE